MKTSLILSTVSLAAMLCATPLRAGDPSAIKLTPQVQALLNDLLKSAGEAPTEEPVPADPAPSSTAPSAPAAPAPGRKSPQSGPQSGLRTSSLSSGRLTTGSLTPSAGLDGRGVNGAPRLSKEEWRELFPVKNSK